MLHFLGIATLSYLGITGLVTNGSVVTRGLMHAGRRLLNGECESAAVEVLASLAAPAVMGFTATSNLIGDVVEGATELFGGVLASSQPEPDPALSVPRMAGKARL